MAGGEIRKSMIDNMRLGRREESIPYRSGVFVVLFRSWFRILSPSHLAFFLSFHNALGGVRLGFVRDISKHPFSFSRSILLYPAEDLMARSCTAALFLFLTLLNARSYSLYYSRVPLMGPA